VGEGIRHPASFRDPSGFVFTRDNVLYRQVNTCYAEDYDALIQSGLYDSLTAAGLLVSHEEVAGELAQSENAYKVLRPEPIPFISYPYELAFSALKAAALATLDIQARALEFGMSLKDASAFNIQFRGAKPIHIDTLSFEKYREGEPWVAYGQFCSHFVAPLSLMAYKDVRLGRLLRSHIDGIPLDLASRLLPKRTYLRPAIAIHVHMHAKAQSKYSDVAGAKPAAKGALTRRGLEGIIDNLRTLVSRLTWKPRGTEWGDYYTDTNYNPESLKAKEDIVTEWLEKIRPKRVADLGANTGRFSRLASDKGIPTVAPDVDPAAVEKNFLRCVASNDTTMLPLLLDLANPSPALGWHHAERQSFLERGRVDLTMALALVHHLALSNNVPLPLLSQFFADMCAWLIIEFIPKSDSQARRLLATRTDIFDDYTEAGFEAAFQQQFLLEEKRPIPGTERTLYLMRRRSSPT
jgi:ribosomal protein L11 methylase PrmA